MPVRPSALVYLYTFQSWSVETRVSPSRTIGSIPYQPNWTWALGCWPTIPFILGRSCSCSSTCHIWKSYITPITVNYINECFIGHPAEASIAVNVYRVGFGLSVAFYIKEWVAETRVGWAYGMMAFFEIGSFLFIVLLMWKGMLSGGWRGVIWARVKKENMWWNRRA